MKKIIVVLASLSVLLIAKKQVAFFFSIFTVTVLHIPLFNKFGFISDPGSYINLKQKNIKFEGTELTRKYPVIFSAFNGQLSKSDTGVYSDYKIKFIIEQQNNADLKKSGSFILKIEPEKLSVISADTAGLINGLSEVENQCITNNGEIKISSNTYVPFIQKRFLHLSIMPKEDLGKMKKYVDDARRNHFNYVIFRIGNRVNLDAMKTIAVPDTWSKNAFQELINYAHDNGISVVPDVPFLSHQELFIQKPEWLYNSRTYNPDNKQVQEICNAVIDELLDMMKPEFFHVGHDELIGIYSRAHEKLKENEKPLPAYLFLTDVIRLNKYITAKNVTTMMWADMFLKSDDFPQMKDAKFFHADESYKKIITQIPKNIILCDWQYFETNEVTTTSYLQKFGFITYGSTWWDTDNINAFLKIYKNIPFAETGMITTTWEGALKNVNEKNNFEITVESIAKNSGRTYWEVKQN